MRSSAPLRAAEAASRTASPTWHGSVRVLRSMAFRRPPEARTRPAWTVPGAGIGCPRRFSDFVVEALAGSPRHGSAERARSRNRRANSRQGTRGGAPDHNDLALARALLHDDGEAGEMANNHRVISVGGGFGTPRPAQALHAPPACVALLYQL